MKVSFGRLLQPTVIEKKSFPRVERPLEGQGVAKKREAGEATRPRSSVEMGKQMKGLNLSTGPAPTGRWSDSHRHKGR